MKIVIDTNVFVNIFFAGSCNHWIWTALEFGRIRLCISTDILDEYEEIITRLYTKTMKNLLIVLLLAVQRTS